MLFYYSREQFVSFAVEVYKAKMRSSFLLYRAPVWFLAPTSKIQNLSKIPKSLQSRFLYTIFQMPNFISYSILCIEAGLTSISLMYGRIISALQALFHPTFQSFSKTCKDFSLSLSGNLPLPPDLCRNCLLGGSGLPAFHSSFEVFLLCLLLPTVQSPWGQFTTLCSPGGTATCQPTTFLLALLLK